jgi:flagella basal body P-ring formation protein FlgA
VRYACLALFLWIGTVAHAAQAVLAADAPASVAATPIAVTILDQGICNEDEVRLGEIAQITGPAVRVARLQRLPVARAPEAGQERTLAREDIETVLRASTDGRIGVVVTGAQRTLVRAGVQIVEGERLAAAAVRAVEEQLAGRPDVKAQIEVTHVPLAVRLRPAEIELRSELRDDELPSGSLNVRVRLFQGLRSVAETSVGVRVKLSQMVPVASRKIAEGELLGESDLTMESREVGGSRWEPAEPARIIGRAARQAIARGKVLEAKMFEAPTVIRRGDRVRLTLSRGVLVVVTQAEARSDAVDGQTVRLRLIDSGSEVLGTATGPSEAKM